MGFRTFLRTEYFLDERGSSDGAAFIIALTADISLEPLEVVMEVLTETTCVGHTHLPELSQ